MTPQHIIDNHHAMLEKLNSTSTVNDMTKMYLRTVLDKCLISTNGRTTEEKIQDITEQVSEITQMTINETIEMAETLKRITKQQEIITDKQDEIARIQEETVKALNAMRENDEEQRDKILDNNAKLDEIKNSVDVLVKEHQPGGKYDFETNFSNAMANIGDKEPKTKLDKVLHFFIHLPWSFTVLGLGVVALFAFRPELVALIKGSI